MINRILLLLLLCVLFFGNDLNSQKIEIVVSNEKPFTVFDQITLEIHIINNTDESFTFFSSHRGSYYSFREEWNNIVNGNSVNYMEHGSIYNEKYSLTSVETIYPGERKVLAYRPYKFTSPGTHEINYTHRQSPEFVSRDYARNNTVYQATQNIKTFEASASIVLTAEDIVSKSSNVKARNISWDYWKQNRDKELYDRKGYYFKLEDALSNPDKALGVLVNCNGLDVNMLNRLLELPNLKLVTFSNWNLSEFPESLTKLDVYELEFDFERGTTVVFPDSFGKMYSLRSLSFARHSGFVPQVLGLENLESLWFTNCNVNELPDLSSLPNLKNLNLRGNQISSLDQARLDKLLALQEIDLSFNRQLASIEALMNNKMLISLNAASCNILEIPIQIGNLNKLEILHLSHNVGISTVPDGICELEHLNVLWLQGLKSIRTLPSCMINLSELRDVNFGETGLRELPIGFSNLPIKEMKIYRTRCKKGRDYKVLKNRLGKNFMD